MSFYKPIGRIVACGLCTVAILGSGRTGWSQSTPAPAAKPAVEGKDGWGQIDQRLVFLTVELSTVESSIAATNKALKTAGYKLADLTSDAEKARDRNNRMDQQGGGPVPWSQFYGRTARDFFYHPADGNTIYVNPLPVDQRPPQFDYIYRANEDNRARAEAAAANVGTKIDDLLAHRKVLEEEQFTLWCKISFRAVASKELANKPLYRYALQSAGSTDLDKNHLAVVKAGVDFIKAVNSAIARAQSGIESDPKNSLDELLRSTTAARTDVDTQLLQWPSIGAELADPRSQIGQFRHATQQMQDFAENLVDAFKTSTAADLDNDPTRKNTSRGQFQQAVSSYSEALLASDAYLTGSAKAWSIAADTKGPPPVVETPAGGDSIGARLQAAKAEAQSDLIKARQTLVGVIDSRMNDAADAGDLAKVQSLQLAKSSAARDGSIPADTGDTAVVSAKTSYDSTVKSANDHLAAAYKTAIHDFTRARQFTEAQAAQDEFNASGLSGTTASETPSGGGAATAGVAGPAEANVKLGPLVRLSRSLPSFLTGQEFSSADNGIQLSAPLQSRDTNVLTRDFIFDVEWDRKEKGDPIFVGVCEGAGTRNEKQTSLKAYPSLDGNGTVTLTNNDEWGNEMGHLPEPGKYIIRVEKIGRTIIFAIGTEEAGKFKPILAREVVDIHTFNEELHDASTHVYVKGGKNDTLTRARFASGISLNANQPKKDLPFGTFSLQRVVPGFLTGKACNVNADGIAPHGQKLETISPAILTRDFNCDVTFHTHKDTTAWIGLGQTGGNDWPSKFIALCVRVGGDNRASVGLHHSEEWVKGFTELTEAGEYVARITKQGHEITFAVGTGEGSEFKALGSRTIGDVTSYDTDLNASNTHLFLGGNITYSNITLSATAPAPPAHVDETPAPGTPPIDLQPKKNANGKTTDAAQAPAGTPVTPAFDGFYWVINQKTGHCLAVTEANKNQGNWVSLKKKNNADSEKWSLNVPSGFAGVRFVNKFSSKTMSARAGNKNPGNDMIEWNNWTSDAVYDKPADDNWKIEKVGDNFKFTNELTGLVLTEDHGRDQKAVQQPWKGTDDQLWRVEKAK